MAAQELDPRVPLETLDVILASLAVQRLVGVSGRVVFASRFSKSIAVAEGWSL